MNFHPPDAEAQIHFLVKIQRLLGEGRFVASYKFALIQALADLSVEKEMGLAAPLKLTASDIAEKFIQYYWRQSLPLAAGSGEKAFVLKQNTGSQATIVNIITSARASAGGSLAKAQSDRKLWKNLVSNASQVIQKMPLWKLQVVGKGVDDFLYPQTGKGSVISLRPEAVFCLRQFHALIQSLIQGEWVRYIRSIGMNQNLLGEAVDLREFLFGSERESLKGYNQFLKDIQSGRCFYCGRRIEGKSDVDHFIPWAKYPVDLGHNFVLAHPDCNRSKRDYLAAENHLHNWVERNDRRQRDLAQFFDEKGILNSLSSSMQITCWAYEQAASSGAQVWVSGEETRPLGGYWEGLLRHRSDVTSMAAEKEPRYE